MAKKQTNREPAKREAVSAWTAAFIRRTKKARQERTNLTQTEMARLLGIGKDDNTGQGTYKNYETNRPLPHEYIPDFLRLTGVTYEWLFEEKQRRNREKRVFVVHQSEQS